jgi:hypothetical protein
VAKLASELVQGAAVALAGGGLQLAEVSAAEVCGHGCFDGMARGWRGRAILNRTPRGLAVT